MTRPVLRLYVAGTSAASRRAEQNFLRIQHLMNLDESDVELVDVLTNPQLAEDAGILATPTLSYECLESRRRIVGDLSDIKRVMDFLGIDEERKLKGKTA